MALYTAQFSLKDGSKTHEYYLHASSPTDGVYKHEGANPKKNATMGSMMAGVGNALAVAPNGNVLVAGFTDCCVAYRNRSTVGGVAPGVYKPQPTSPYDPNQSEVYQPRGERPRLPHIECTR